MKPALLVALPLAVVDCKIYRYVNNRFMEFASTTRTVATPFPTVEELGIPNPGGIFWYEDRYCPGDSIAGSSSKGSINFEGTKLYNKESPMVQQDLVDYCHESSTVNRTATLYLSWTRIPVCLRITGHWQLEQLEQRYMAIVNSVNTNKIIGSQYAT